MPTVNSMEATAMLHNIKTVTPKLAIKQRSLMLNPEL